METDIFLISELWVDRLTSSWESDHGYTVVGYVESEEEAKKIIKEGDTFIYERIKRFK